jgi:hypothetical protein
VDTKVEDVTLGAFVCALYSAQIVSVADVLPEEPYFAEHLSDLAVYTWAQTVNDQKTGPHIFSTAQPTAHRGQVQGGVGSVIK